MTSHRCFATLLVLLLASFAFAADNESYGVWYKQVKVGQTVAEVHAILGTPTSVFTPGSDGRGVDYETERWAITQHDTISVRFDDGKVGWVGRFDPKPPKEQVERNDGFGVNGGFLSDGKGERAIGIALNLAQSFLYSHNCPIVYRKPMIFMTANDIQWFRACNANGYMLFGMYVYTGN